MKGTGAKCNVCHVLAWVPGRSSRLPGGVGAYANRSAVPDQRYYFSTFVTLRVAEIQNNEENVSEKQASKTW